MKTIKLSCYFPPAQFNKPIMSVMVRDYNLEVNILHADISLTKRGKLVVDITGEEKDIVNAIEYIRDEGIQCKVFNRKIIWNEDECIHCGACTAICPSNALSMNVATACLEFDKEKCLVCELCVKACPLNVMNISI